MKYKAVIFDFDYTLGDCTEGIFECVNFALERMGLQPAGLEQVKRGVGLSLEETYVFLTGESDTEKEKIFTGYFKEKADEVMVSCSRFLPFARETLEMLYVKRIPVGIVTTKYKFRIEGILKMHMAEALVQYICGSDMVACAKPDPEGLLATISRMGRKPEEVIYVGDSLVDAKTAQNACVDFGAVTTGTTTQEDFMSFPHVLVMEDLRPVLTLI